jgi:hypothetical protein
MVVKLTSIDLSLDCMCYIPISTSCTLTHTQWGDHSNTHRYCHVNMQVDPVEKTPQIQVMRV